MPHGTACGRSTQRKAHDFILTRNHHGVGFWENDRWQRPWGDTLTVLCNLAGEIDIYLGDDGLLYPE